MYVVWKVLCIVVIACKTLLNSVMTLLKKSRLWDYVPLALYLYGRLQSSITDILIYRTRSWIQLVEIHVCSLCRCKQNIDTLKWTFYHKKSWNLLFCHFYRPLLSCQWTGVCKVLKQTELYLWCPIFHLVDDFNVVTKFFSCYNHHSYQNWNLNEIIQIANHEVN